MGTLTLEEFYALDEGRAVHYTLEPEANGRGRLLRWEEEFGPGAEPGGATREAIASGDVEELLAALAQDEPAAGGVADEVRRAWDEAVSRGGESVWFGIEGGRSRVDIQARSRDDGPDGDPWDGLGEEEDGADRYF